MNYGNEFIGQVEEVLANPQCGALTIAASKKLLSLLTKSLKALHDINKYMFTTGDFPKWENRSKDNQEAVIKSLLKEGGIEIS